MSAAKKEKAVVARSISAAQAPGVIATIVNTISRAKDASIDEIVEVLVKTFPDRDADGMKATTRNQANRNCTSKERDEKRGLIYYKRR